MRVAAFIDGFNMYHRIDDYWKATGTNLKWLDYRSLMTSLLQTKTDELVHVQFFTALDAKRGKDKPDSLERHQRYITALENTGIQVTHGHFKYKTVACRSKTCRSTWEKPEEKETDVNLALALIEQAYLDTYDICFLITGDTDIVPAVQLLTKHWPSKIIIPVLPPSYNQRNPKDYKNKSSYRAYSSLLPKPRKPLQLSFTKLEEHQFPNEFTTKFGKTLRNPYLPSTETSIL